MSGPQRTTDELAARVRAGDARALGRAISLVEAGGRGATALLEALPGQPGAYAVGVTGPPGVGKSTLVAALVAAARAQDLAVGVLAVDPTSPFSGGALLGDRVRMAEHFLDPAVFIRSMASAGHLGGLAAATGQALRVLGAAGKDVVFVETVGAGQADVAVATVADLVVLVLMPATGDAVQALKAGILEVPDLIALNKCDLPGAGAAAAELRRALALGGGEPTTVVLTDARRAEGVEELWRQIEDRRAADEADGSLASRRGDRLAAEATAVALARAGGYLENALAGDAELRSLLDAVRSGRLEPVRAADEITRKVFGIGDEDSPHDR